MISVLICTHNPNPVFFKEVLLALKQQDYPHEKWELVVVDNASEQPVSNQFDFSWHPNTRLVIESNLGVAHARYRACIEAKGTWFVYVDDDNVLSRNYLSTAANIIEKRPYMGCFGGKQIGRFIDGEPAKEIKPYLSLIAVRDVPRARISNLYAWETTPAGAGMIIRASVVWEYVAQVNQNPIRKSLGRRGASLMSSEDIDIAYTALDMGYMSGLFPELTMEHIIPGKRLTLTYLLQLKFYNIYSSCMLDYIRFRYTPSITPRWQYGLFQFWALLHGRSLVYKMRKAERSAIRLFLRDIKLKKFD